MADWEIVERPAHLSQRDMLGEGPVWDAEGQGLYWVDIVGKTVFRLEPSSGEVRAWATPAHVAAAVPRRSGGLLVALVDGLHAMSLATGLVTPFARPDPDPANRSNDSRTDPQGRFWLGTMNNNLAANGSPRPIRGSTGGLFRVEADGRSTQVLSGVGITNSLCWSPDGRTLYFADTLLGTIWAFPFEPETGELGERRVFAGPDAAPGHPDGASVDEAGRLWSARWGAGRVTCFSPDGRVEREIELPAAQPTCTAFGGPDRRTLYVTSARQELEGLAPDSPDGALFAVPVDTPGLASAPFAG